MKRRTQLTRRQTLKLFGATATWATLAACTPGAVSPSATASAGASLTPKVGGRLNVALVSDLPRLDYAHAPSNQAAVTITNVYDQLIEIDDQKRVQPRLAETFDVSSDGKEVKMTLRKGVQFHSGREFTSDDVRYNVLRVRDAAKVGGTQLGLMSNWFSDVQTPDKYTVVMKLDKPQVAMISFFDYLAIVDKDTVDGANAKTQANGTGPFTFVEWSPGDHFTLAKNKNYWRSGLPYLDEVVVRIVKDQQTAAIQLESGAVDIALPLEIADLIRLRSDPRYKVLAGGSAIVVLFMNVLQRPTSNKKFRQGLQYAMDRQRFAQAAYLGLGEPRNLPWPASSSANEPEKQKTYTFDLDKARALIAESGETIREFDLIYYPGTGVSELAEIFQADLAKIGVKLNLKFMEQAAWLTLVTPGRPTFNGIAGARLANVVGEEDPSMLFVLSRNFVPSPHPSGFKSERLDQLVAASGTEVDVTKRKAIYSQINDLWLDESYLIIPCGTEVGGGAALAKANLQGYRTVFQKGRFPYTTMWLS